MHIRNSTFFLLLLTALSVPQATFAQFGYPSCTLKASPTSISGGQSTTLTWTSVGALSGVIDNGVGALSPISSGSRVVKPSQTTTYTATVYRTSAAGVYSGTCKATVTVTSSQPSPACTLSVSPNPVQQGATATLSWSSTNAESGSIDQGVGSMNPIASGSVLVAPSATTTYTATVTGASGQAQCLTTLSVAPVQPSLPPTVTLTANPTTIQQGATSTLSWSSANATSCSASGGWSGIKATSGTQPVSPTATTTYTLACTGAGGTGSASVMVGVAAPAPPPGVFTPESFGAIANNSTDSTNGIRKAIKAAMEYGQPAIVQLSPGTYRVSCTPGVGGAGQYCFELSSAKNITVKGAGSTQTHFIVTTPTAGLFEIVMPRYGGTHTQAENITIQGFSVDYDPLPFTQGKVVAVNAAANTIDVQIDPGYPLPNSESFAPQIYSWARTFGMLFSATTPRLKSYVDTAFFTVSQGQISTNTWRYFDEGGRIGTQAAVGDRFAMQGGRVLSGLIYLARVKNATISDIVAYGGSGGVQFVNGEGTLTVDKMQIRRKPGTNRLLSLNSNGIAFFHSHGRPVLTNNHIEGLGDDPIANAAKGNLITEVFSDTEFAMVDENAVNVGDRVQVVDSCANIRGEATVIDVMIDQPYVKATVTLGSPIPGMRSSGGQASCATGTGSPWSGFENDMVFNMSAAGPNALIKNNTFGATRGVVYSYGPGARFEGNTFTDFEGHIGLGASTAWREGPIPRDITITGNTMQGQYEWPGFVYMSAPSGGIKNVTVSNNTFKDTQTHAIVVNGAQNVRITNNSLTNASTWPLNKGQAPIVVAEASGIVVNGFTIVDPRTGAGPGVRIENTVAPGTQGISVTNLTVPRRTFFGGAYVPILDLRTTQTAAVINPVGSWFAQLWQSFFGPAA